MLHLFRLLLPYLLVFFVVLKGTKERLFLLGIPFLMFMSDSLFFNSAKIFHIPGSLDDQLLFIWIIILWIFSKITATNTISNNINKNAFNFPDFCVICLTIITIINFLIIVVNYPILTNVVREFFIDISLFVGYFIVKNWISSNTPVLIVRFLYFIVIANSIACALYLLNQGLHFNIYPQEEGIAEIFDGKEIIRNFSYMPQFLLFSVIYILIFTKKYSIISIGLLILNLLAIFVSYTRSSVINIGFIFLLYFILISLKRRNVGLIFRNIIIYGLLSVIAIFLLAKFLPTKTQFLIHRFSELGQSSAQRGEENNLQFRFTNTEHVISNMAQNKKAFGMGPVTVLQNPNVTEMQQTTSDMVWPGVIFRWGIVGLILFILIYVSFAFKAFRFFMVTEGVLSDLGLLFFIYIISQIIESFVSWTFLSAHGFATGLWYFAMLSALLSLNKNVEVPTYGNSLKKLKVI